MPTTTLPARSGFAEASHEATAEATHEAPSDAAPETTPGPAEERPPAARCPVHDGASMAALRARRVAGESLFAMSKGLAVLDPEAAQAANAANFADTTLPDRLVDLVLQRPSPHITWNEVRAAWMPTLKRLAEPEPVAALDARLRHLLDARLDDRVGRPLDLTRAIQEVFTRALIPVIMDGLAPAERARVVRDQDDKLDRLLRPVPRDMTFRETMRSAWLQIRTGRVARAVLRGRATGRRPRRLDLADPIVELLPRLGMDRAAHAVTSVLTAVAGPPGAVAVCLLLELARRPAWAARLADEQAAIDTDAYHAGAARLAPQTHRFVKETLRCWSAPLVLTRVTRTPLTVGDHALEVGDLFHLSPYFVNRDADAWPDADTFDPDRWRAGSGRGPARSCAYVPFGWMPTSCIGAGLGLVELMLLARLFTTVYRLEPTNLDQVEIVMASVPLPQRFEGRLLRR